MRGVLFVLAVVFEDISVGHQLVRNLHAEGLGVHLRIVEADFVIHVSEVAAPEALRYMKRVTVRMTHAVEPGLIIKTGGFHHQRFSFPMSGRVTVEGREVEFLWKNTAIR